MPLGILRLSCLTSCRTRAPCSRRGVVLVRRWGRIGTAGRTQMDEHHEEGRVFAALDKP
jgi:predicted DNA-binding WGR domain protein